MPYHPAFEFKHLVEADLPLLHGWLLRPHVAQWWGEAETVDELRGEPAVSVVQTDPSPDNARAIRCYVAAGFEAVGEVQTPDGPALLMRCRRRP